eukprot:364842-Chlamydomonas_euryale.AAC.5
MHTAELLGALVSTAALRCPHDYVVWPERPCLCQSTLAGSQLPHRLSISLVARPHGLARAPSLASPALAPGASKLACLHTCMRPHLHAPSAVEHVLDCQYVRVVWPKRLLLDLQSSFQERPTHVVISLLQMQHLQQQQPSPGQQRQHQSKHISSCSHLQNTATQMPQRAQHPQQRNTRNSSKHTLVAATKTTDAPRPAQVKATYGAT